MPRQKKTETKTVDTKAPKAGKVEKKKQAKKEVAEKVVEKVIKATGKSAKEVKQVPKSVPAQEKGKKKKDVVMSSSSSEEEAESYNASSASGSGSGSGSSSSGSGSGSSSSASGSGSSSSSASGEASPVADEPQGDGKIYVGNLSFSVTDDDTKNYFASCGTITEIVWGNRNGKFDGSGVLTFSKESEAQAALKKNDTEFLGRRIRVVKNYSKGEAFAGEPSTNVFLNNLSFDITEDDLRGVYSECGEIVSVRFPQRGGMAFVEFSSVDEAKAAIAKSFELDIKGRAVRAEFAKSSNRAPAGAQGGRQGGFGGKGGQGAPGAFKSPKPANGTTFFVGGLPDSTEEKDLHTAFPGCGIANIRWVERDGVFKGVAFVEFADTNEADKAFAIASKGVTIGRRSLRFDWAEGRRK